MPGPALCLGAAERLQEILYSDSSFLKRERERFHYSFQDIPDRSALQAFTFERFLERSHDRS